MNIEENMVLTDKELLCHGEGSALERRDERLGIRKAVARLTAIMQCSQFHQLYRRGGRPHLIFGNEVRRRIGPGNLNQYDGMLPLATATVVRRSYSYLCRDETEIPRRGMQQDAMKCDSGTRTVNNYVQG